MIKNFRLSVSLLICLVACQTAVAGIGATEHLAMQGEAAVVTQTRLPVMRGIVHCVEHCPGMNGTPPVLELHIEKTLRGTLPQRSIRASWQPYPLDLHGNGSGVSEAEKAAWAAKPLAPPVDGSRWILVGGCFGGEIMVHPLGRWSYTPTKEAEVRGWIKQREPLCELSKDWEKCNGRRVRLVTPALSKGAGPAYVVPGPVEKHRNACESAAAEYYYVLYQDKPLVFFFAPGEFSSQVVQGCSTRFELTGRLEIHHGQGYLPWLRVESLKCL